MLATYRVVAVRNLDGTSSAPLEVVERFQNRLWTPRELEERGVRITGAGAWYLALGLDWQLQLEPASA